ncbi:MAG: FtsH protease activity modulator HflK [Solobacterium sp.]|nr:FtsH protease activity modulator HflK [Solobacterium sp.]
MVFLSIMLFALLIVAAIMILVRYTKEPEKFKQAFEKNRKYFLPAAGVILVVILISGSFYSVSEDQQAVVTTFGKVVRTDSAGVHFKLPLIQQVHKVDVTTHGASIGYEIANSNQEWGYKENPQMITSDFNLIDVDFYIEYKVNDPVAYLYNSEDPEIILNNEAMSSIRGIISDYKVDDVMTTAKGEIQQKIKDSLIEKLSERNIGIQLVNVMIQDVEPPTNEVMSAFKSVETAKQGADTAINNANRYKNEQLPHAEAEADKIIQAAEAGKAARIAEAEGQAARFNKMYEEYQKYPLITKKRLFYETMEDVLPDLEVVITDGNTQNILPIGSLVGGMQEGGN